MKCAITDVQLAERCFSSSDELIKAALCHCTYPAGGQRELAEITLANWLGAPDSLMLRRSMCLLRLFTLTDSERLDETLVTLREREGIMLLPSTVLEFLLFHADVEFGRIWTQYPVVSTTPYQLDIVRTAVPASYSTGVGGGGICFARCDSLWHKSCRFLMAYTD